MSIIFNFGEHFHENSTLFIIDILITAFGAFLGFLGAFWLNRWIERRNIKKEKRQKEEEYLERLKYIENKINSIIDFVPKQNEAYLEIADETDKEPLEFHFVKKFASFNLERLKGLDSDSIFSAYSYFFNYESNYYKNYKNIFDSADFLYSVS